MPTFQVLDYLNGFFSPSGDRVSIAEVGVECPAVPRKSRSLSEIRRWHDRAGPFAPGMAQYWFCANSKSSLIVKFRISQICRLAPSSRVWRAREGHLGMPGAARQMMVPELASQFSADTEDRLFKLDRFLPGSATRIRQPASGSPDH
jgi:hypothetical protein